MMGLKVKRSHFLFEEKLMCEILKIHIVKNSDLLYNVRKIETLIGIKNTWR